MQNSDLHIARLAAVAAGKEMLRYYKQSMRVKEKEDGSPFTQADATAESAIRDILSATSYPILSEEGEDDTYRLGADKVWIVDPLDGTRDFLEQTGEFSVLIALVFVGKPVLGVVYSPTEEKLYFAEKGKGAWVEQGSRNISRLAVAEEHSLSRARIVVSRHHFAEREKEYIQREGIEHVMRMGSSGLKLTAVAEGKADGYIALTDKTKEWDIAAPEIIVTEAGGIVSDETGKELTYNRRDPRNTKGIVAGSPFVHRYLVASLGKG